MTPEEWPHIRSIARWVLPVLVGPRIARTGASERGAIISECGSAPERKVPFRTEVAREFRLGFNLDFGDHGRVLTSPKPRRIVRSAEATARALAPALPRPGWKSAGVLALLCSGVAWASLPRVGRVPPTSSSNGRRSAIAPLSSGGTTGMPMVATEAVEPVEFVPQARRGRRSRVAAGCSARSGSAGPMRIRGRVGDGLYWSLRAAGASPQVAAQYLSALATEIDVGRCGTERQLRHGARAQSRIALRRARPRRRRRLATGAVERERPQRMDRRGQRRPAGTGRKRHGDAGRRADHLLFRLSLSPDPALHPLPRRASTSARAGAARSSPPGRPGCRARAGPAVTAARSRSPMAAGWSASTAT